MFRIRKTGKGFIVEFQNRTWYGRKYWTHYIGVAGMEDYPWHHHTVSLAIMNATEKMTKELVNNIV